MTRLTTHQSDGRPVDWGQYESASLFYLPHLLYMLISHLLTRHFGQLVSRASR